MYKLINLNGTDVTNPEGDFSISKSDTVNEYVGEDGHKTVEIIRQNVISASVSYKGLTDTQVKTIADLITTVSTIKLYDALTNTQKTITARVSNISVEKVYHRNDLSVWSLSFDIDEL